MYKSTAELNHIHTQEDIHIICAGPSSKYIEPSFYENKIVIGINNVYKRFPSNYIVAKDLREVPRFNRLVEELKQTNIKLVFPEYHTGHYNDPKNTPDMENAYMFEHLDNKSATMDDEVLSAIGSYNPDRLVVSRSTITSGIHLAAYMGAKNIILLGHDCGFLDEDLYEPTYTENDWGSADNYSSAPAWVGSIESNTLRVNEKIKEHYGCNIYSINPFINFGLEGHKYKSNSREWLGDRYGDAR